MSSQIKNNNMRNSNIDVTVIVPVFNVEEYLPICIDSILQQEQLHYEVILVNDGSTDRSGAIADKYAEQDSRIRVIHQENGGISVARNNGLDLAQGEYIVFIDSDDWIRANSLSELYYEAAKYRADVMMGNLWFCNEDGSKYTLFAPIPKEMRSTPFCGKECFIRLVESRAYPPMVCNYIFRRQYLKEIEARFEEGIIHEDELWTPIVLCQAERVVTADVDFYNYRQRTESVTHTTNIRQRLNALVHVTDKLLDFADRFDFLGKDAELSNWLYVNIYRLYATAFSILPRIKDSSHILPKHQLDRLWKNSWKMMPGPQKICRDYFRQVEIRLKKYTDWRISDWVACVSSRMQSNKKLMLIYNTMWNEDLEIKVEDVPEDWIITTDRRYFQQADAVVFHLPDLVQEMEHNLPKQPEQIWIAWYLESEENYQSFIKDPEVSELFDLWMSYRQQADVVYPYYETSYMTSFREPVSDKQNKTCMFVSSPINQSKRIEYLEELMRYTPIDSYGRLYNNKQLPIDRGKETKLDIYRGYKFVIAFENAVDPDYVTEKFFDPLLAGSVPVYFGAPNIADFAPGKNCFIDVRQFENPKKLADFINSCYEDQLLYESFLAWREKELLPSFVEKAELQHVHPIVRLCVKIREVLEERCKTTSNY
jgi:glycosyltransferase involved in cell wall biosynthesis